MKAREKPLYMPSVWQYEEYETGDLVCSGCGALLITIVYKGMAVSYRGFMEREIKKHLDGCKQVKHEHQRTRPIPA